MKSLLIVLAAACLVAIAVEQHALCLNNCMKDRPSRDFYYELMTAYLTDVPYFNRLCLNITTMRRCITGCGQPQVTGYLETDCSIASLPLYEVVCNGGYKNFKSLGSCYKNLKTELDATVNSCGEQCPIYTIGYIPVTYKYVLHNYCAMNCSLIAMINTVQQECSPWVGLFAETIQETFPRMRAVSPDCISIF